MVNTNHMIITGTGRAGTSFLVQYLHMNGFDTQLKKKPKARLDRIANAGLEDFPYPSSLTNLPYIFKSPWLSFDPENLISKEIEIDAIIVPIRSLSVAATSRVINEVASTHIPQVNL